MWRLGHRDAPLDYVPRQHCGWQHRWDDPEREYRTLYCAESELTCLREVLADLRPNAKALAELREAFGAAPLALTGVGEVGPEWRETKLLAPAQVERDSEFADFEVDVALRMEAEAQLSELLAEHGMEHLDTSEVRSRDRPITQAAGRLVYEDGYAGVRFGSNLDSGPCFALFEGHAWLEPRGEPVELTTALQPLVQVCKEFGLTLV